MVNPIVVHKYTGLKKRRRSMQDNDMCFSPGTAERWQCREGDGVLVALIYGHYSQRPVWRSYRRW